jgi:hypothetical protein
MDCVNFFTLPKLEIRNNIYSLYENNNYIFFFVIWNGDQVIWHAFLIHLSARENEQTGFGETLLNYQPSDRFRNNPYEQLNPHVRKRVLIKKYCIMSFFLPIKGD